MNSDLRALGDGTIGGCLGTIAMSVVMVAGQKVGALGRQPPERIAAAGLDALGVQRTRTVQAGVAVLLHIVFGSAAGALFGLLYRRLRAPLDPSLQGVIFASMVWAASYKGWIPALGIMPPPERDRAGRPVIMVLAHWLYGATLGMLVGRKRQVSDRNRGRGG